MTPGEGQRLDSGRHLRHRRPNVAGSLKASDRVEGDFGRDLGARQALRAADAGGIHPGEPWSGIGYAGFDNVAKKYDVTYMDGSSTA